MKSTPVLPRAPRPPTKKQRAFLASIYPGLNDMSRDQITKLLYDAARLQVQLDAALMKAYAVIGNALP